MNTTAATAGEQVYGKVRDHYTTIYDTVEVIDRRCELIDVPVYEQRHVGGNNAAGGALLGMIIGGAAGKAITGKDNGAAAGAIMGGIIGADKGGKGHTENVIVGYRKEKSCTDDVSYQQKPKKVYSHSTLSFTLDGKHYKVNFNK
jgi:uncharacterized protein YcfJ